jgi:hypothetical protein
MPTRLLTQRYSICRSTRRTSTRSRCRSATSKHFCESSQSEPPRSLRRTRVSEVNSTSRVPTDGSQNPGAPRQRQAFSDGGTMGQSGRPARERSAMMRMAEQWTVCRAVRARHGFEEKSRLRIKRLFGAHRMCRCVLFLLKSQTARPTSLVLQATKRADLPSTAHLGTDEFSSGRVAQLLATSHRVHRSARAVDVPIVSRPAFRQSSLGTAQ